MLIPAAPTADSPNYFLLESAAIICIFHLAVVDVCWGGATLFTLRLNNF